MQICMAEWDIRGINDEYGWVEALDTFKEGNLYTFGVFMTKLKGSEILDWNKMKGVVSGFLDGKDHYAEVHVRILMKYERLQKVFN